MDEFDAITVDLQATARAEQEEQAREILALADATRDYDEVLRAVPRREVIGLAFFDGTSLRGRVLVVGRDWLRLAEVVEEGGAARARPRRVHDVRLAAVVRISRESAR